MKRVWKGAVAILQEDDRDSQQQLPKDLDDSGPKFNGRAHIKALIETRVTVSSAETFIEASSDFLSVITHESLLDCLAVDTYIGGIYNFISGVNGNRAISFFEHLYETLVATRTNNALSLSQKILEDSLVGLSTALREVLKRDQRARFNEQVEALVNSLDTAGQIIPAEAPLVISVIKRILADIRAMIARAKGLVADGSAQEDDSTSSPVRTTSYPRDVVIPRNRHDNDEIDIAEIIIFPTRDEIMSNAKECLPSTDPDQPHFIEDQIGRHIDTNFRLLRHDIFGDMKKALATLMHAAMKDPASLSNMKVKLGDMRVYHYNEAHISYVTFDSRHGLEARISFAQPAALHPKSAAERRTWWEESRRLNEGSLLSFIWVHKEIVQHLFLEVTRKTTAVEQEHGLTHDSAIAKITAKLMTQNSRTLQLLMSSNFHNGVLLEFPKVLPATFVPILVNLQNMQRLSQLRFRQWILPDQHNGPPDLKIHHDIPPPLYAQTPGFTFPLKPILKTASEDFVIDPSASCNDTTLIEKIVMNTELDRGQCTALVAALTREFAFIQGPPGTGKSYLGLQIMKILLNIKQKAKLGPIVIVCYTNHALDQFLEHLLHIGVRKIIRVGGQSKSEQLEGYNLRVVAQGEGKTKMESWQTSVAYSSLDSSEEQAESALSRLRVTSKHAEWKHLDKHIAENYPRIHHQFVRTGSDGFTTVGRHPFDIWKPTMTASESLNPAVSTIVDAILGKANLNVYSLSHAERRMALEHWVDEVRFDEISRLSTIVSEAAETQARLSNIHDEANRRVLQGADVIGVTTSGLAKRISVLQHVTCKVMICEEAGEVMEPHMLSALLPTVEHCIQIGDHEQLRPSINNFKELSLESKQGSLHKLDRSQFERLSVGERGRPLMPVAQLDVQRRMRPEFSMLVRETLYPQLKDHPSTASLPNVVGMRKNLFWLDHRNFEDDKDSDIHHSKSKSNSWEIKLVHALVRHVVRQGVYKSSEIAVLTPYTGQLQKLRTAMRSDFEIVLSDRDQDALEKDGFNLDDTVVKTNGSVEQQSHRRKPLEKKKLSDLLRVATVDNFQGEEAKIIIVSLVRSNKEGKVGFLKTTNRVNVLLSRAQYGMYLIGNAETYSTVDMWQKVLDMLRISDSVGDALGLCCSKHPEKVLEVQQPEDFIQLSPEGGCLEACNERLTDCGHQCQARCHSTAMHNVFRCEKPCERQHEPCNHPCQKATCGEDCGLCMIKVNNVKLPCGHVQNRVLCYMTLTLQSIRCNATVQKKVSGCQHEVTVKCSKDVNTKDFKCPTPCEKVLPCGHICPGTCGQCATKDKDGQIMVKHLQCKVTCGRKFSSCTHTCPRKCHDGTDCGLCQRPCEVRCKHSRCALKCHEPCAPCIEKCAWSCEHQGQCTMPCAAPCSRLPCDERCTMLLPCGHQCPSICGEACPVEYCQECGMKLEEMPDLILGTQYGDLDLSEAPIVVLGCRHFFTIETLDGMIGLRDVYEIDKLTDRFVALIENTELAAAVPQCPTCRCPIRQFITQRYNRVINRAVVDEMSKRFIISGQQELQGLEDRLKNLGEELSMSREKVTSRSQFPAGQDYMALKKINGNIANRYGHANVFAKNLELFQKSIATQHQPVHKLHQATVHAMTQNSSIESAIATLSLQSSAKSARRDCDRRITFGGRLLDLKIRCLVLEDKLEIARAVRPYVVDGANSINFRGGGPVKQIRSFVHDCTRFVEDCINESFPKLAVEATLHYASLIQLLGSSGLFNEEGREKLTRYQEIARALLEKAVELCEEPFLGAAMQRQAVERLAKLFGKEWYEAVSKEELEEIKKAMVSGSRGIATHSGHWYNCVNGHPFAIGECGMPMQLARCPECGATVGGQSHVAVPGVTRASNME